ncbi:hypothetical protein, partial [Proteus mirabilis]|uniref:hypothetical protein n=1 Tax=Proteus mirabilis TaxID=584 RepID=UPI001EF89627
MTKDIEVSAKVFVSKGGPQAAGRRRIEQDQRTLAAFTCIANHVARELLECVPLALLVFADGRGRPRCRLAQS